MFIQLNPDVESFSETISTLKFAERVSGVELGAARSNKEGRGIRELMEQVTNLKDALTKKDEEIARLQAGKSSSGEKGSLTYSSCFKSHSMGGDFQPNNTPSDNDNCSEFGDGINDDTELLGLGDADSEDRLSDISDGNLSMGTETDGSMSNILETAKVPVENQQKPSVPAKLPRPPQKTTSSSQRQGLIAPSRPSLAKGVPRTASSSSLKKSIPASSSLKSGARR